MRLSTITFVALLFVAAPIFGEASPTYWQVVLSYDPSSLTVLEATPIPPLAKQPRTPGLAGAPIRLEYQTEWIDAAGASLSSAIEEIPLGFRSAPADGAPCQVLMPEAGVIVLRIAGPMAATSPRALRLTGRQEYRSSASALLAVPPIFEHSSIVIPIENFTAAAPRLAGPVGSAKIRDTGPDANRMVVVVMGDGYTSADLTTASFTNAANSLVNAFLGESPWDIGFAVSNVYRVDVTSNQSGSDNDPYGTYKDTYFNSSFWVSGIERLLAIDGVGQSRAIAAANAYVGAGVWDAIFIIVNSTKYGGSGGSIAVASVHPSANDVILHEYGHTYAGLADEYSDAYPGYPPGDPEPNVDYDFSGPGLKWLAWVDSTTPLPTPALSQYANVVGAFEGARYLTSGIYRPQLSCLMRSLGVPFCAICKESHLQTLFGEVSLADSASPPPASTILAANLDNDIVVTPIPIPGLTYQWKIAGNVQPETGPSMTLTAQRVYDIAGGPAAPVSVRISFPSAMIRLFSVGQSINWAARADCNANGQSDDIDLSTGVLHDADSNGVPDECFQPTCCVGLTGNVDCSVGDAVDISDLTALIDHLYISFDHLCCDAEANTDGQGSIDISDLTRLIDYLYISFAPPAACL